MAHSLWCWGVAIGVQGILDLQSRDSLKVWNGVRMHRFCGKSSATQVDWVAEEVLLFVRYQEAASESVRLAFSLAPHAPSLSWIHWHRSNLGLVRPIWGRNS